MSELAPAFDLAALERAFDESFQRPLGAGREATEALLGVRAGAMRVALPVTELAGVKRRPSVTSVPAAGGALAGLGSFRGEIVALYDLALLLGEGARAEDEHEHGWVAFEREGRVGILFDELVAQLAVPAAAFRALPDAAPDALCRRLALVGEARWLVADVGGLVAAAARTGAESARS